MFLAVVFSFFSLFIGIFAYPHLIVNIYKNFIFLSLSFNRLGAVHDGSPPPSYLGGPGAQRCRWEDGYIMSDLRHTERGFRWSPCTVQSFHHFLK